MGFQPYVRTTCLDCSGSMFLTEDAVGTRTRCERCLRKYDQQMHLLRNFLLGRE